MPSGGGGDDKDKQKMSDTMQNAIVKEKPNVKWEDIAGLDQAKEVRLEQKETCHKMFKMTGVLAWLTW